MHWLISYKGKLRIHGKIQINANPWIQQIKYGNQENNFDQHREKTFGMSLRIYDAIEQVNLKRQVRRAYKSVVIYYIHSISKNLLSLFLL